MSAFLDRGVWPDGTVALEAVVFALAWLTGGVAASLPWLAAHLEFWGGRRGSQGDIDAARSLGELAVLAMWPAVLAALAVFAALAAFGAPAFFPAVNLTAPLLLALPPLAAVYALLACLYHFGWGWGERQPWLHLALSLGTGLAALIVAAVLAVVSLCAADPSLWPLLSETRWRALLIEAGLWVRLGGFYASAFTVGGVALMLVGRCAFRWESRMRVSDGARVIRLGALCALVATLVLVFLFVGVVVAAGPKAFRTWMGEGGVFLPIALSLCGVEMVALLEVLVSVLRWRGSAPRASLAAAALLAVAMLTAAGAVSLLRPENTAAQDAMTNAAVEALQETGGR